MRRCLPVASRKPCESAEACGRRRASARPLLPTSCSVSACRCHPHLRDGMFPAAWTSIRIESEGTQMKSYESIVRVGVDLAQSVVQLHAVDASGKVVVASRFSDPHSSPGARNCTRAASSRSKLVPLRTTRRGSCRPEVTRRTGDGHASRVDDTSGGSPLPAFLQHPHACVPGTALPVGGSCRDQTEGRRTDESMEN